MQINPVKIQQKAKVAKFGINDGYGRTEYTGVGYHQNKKPANFFLTYTERNKNNDVIQQHVIHSKDDVSEELYKNEYLPLIMHSGDEYKKKEFLTM